MYGEMGGVAKQIGKVCSSKLWANMYDHSNSALWLMEAGN